MIPSNSASYKPTEVDYEKPITDERDYSSYFDLGGYVAGTIPSVSITKWYVGKNWHHAGGRLPA